MTETKTEQLPGIVRAAIRVVEDRQDGNGAIDGVGCYRLDELTGALEPWLEEAPNRAVWALEGCGDAYIAEHPEFAETHVPMVLTRRQYDALRAVLT